MHGSCRHGVAMWVRRMGRVGVAGRDELPQANDMAPPSVVPCPQDPVLASLENAPVDDEPETLEERAAVARVRAGIRAGAPTIPLEEIAGELARRLIAEVRASSRPVAR